LLAVATAGVATVAGFDRLRGWSVLVNGGSDLFLGGLDGLLFPFVIESGCELVEANAKEAANERADNEEPDVSLLGVSAERSGSDHKTDGKGRVEKGGAGHEEGAEDGHAKADKVHEAVDDGGEDGLASASQEDENEKGSEKDFEDERPVSGGGTSDSERKLLLAPSINGHKTAKNASEELSEYSQKQVDPAELDVTQGDGDRDYGVKVCFLGLVEEYHGKSNRDG